MHSENAALHGEHPPRSKETGMPEQISAAAAARINMRANAALRQGLLLAAKPGAPLQDQIDCAMLAIDAGLREVAAALYALSALQLGVGAGGDLLRAANTQDLLWDSLPQASPVVRESSFSVDLAIGELAQLLALQPDVSADIPELPRVETDLRAGALPDPAVVARADLVLTRLRCLPPHGIATFPAQIGLSVPELLALDPVEPDRHVDASIEVLAALYCLEMVRRFVVTNSDLLGARCEGPLFEQAAGLDGAALGPYFTNVPLLIRSARDIFALIDAAAGESADTGTVETWCALLSTHLRPHQLVDLIDELGDRGMVGAASWLLRRIARTRSSGHVSDAVRRIRDVGLDLGSYYLAAEAQRLIAETRRDDANEWKILGDIEANAGEQARARTAYDRALTLSPLNSEARRNMSMADLGTPVAIRGGFEISEGRRQLRIARAGGYQAARSRV